MLISLRPLIGRVVLRRVKRDGVTPAIVLVDKDLRVFVYKRKNAGTFYYEQEIAAAVDAETVPV